MHLNLLSFVSPHSHLSSIRLFSMFYLLPSLPFLPLFFFLVTHIALLQFTPLFTTFETYFTKVSWPKEGYRMSQVLLGCGVNDLGGTLMNESISTAAGKLLVMALFYYYNCENLALSYN